MSSNGNRPRLERLLRNWLQEDLQTTHSSDTNLFDSIGAEPKILQTTLFRPSSERAVLVGIVSDNPPISGIHLHIASHKTLETQDPAIFRYSIVCRVRVIDVDDKAEWGPGICVSWIHSNPEDLTTFDEALCKLRAGPITYLK